MVSILLDVQINGEVRAYQVIQNYQLRKAELSTSEWSEGKEFSSMTTSNNANGFNLNGAISHFLT